MKIERDLSSGGFGMSDPVVCLATVADEAALLALDHLAATVERRRDFLIRAIRAGECWIAVQEGRIDGLVILDRSFYDQYFVSLLIVREGQRRQGIGTRLMRHVESICPSEKLFTSTNTSNVPMQRLCEQLGYVRSGIIENLDDGDPEIVYFKRLRSDFSNRFA